MPVRANFYRVQIQAVGQEALAALSFTGFGLIPNFLTVGV
jgi:hypothetical protein